MNITIILIGILFSTFSYAAGAKYICKEIADHDPLSIVLTQDGDEKATDGTQEPFSLEVYGGNIKNPILSIKGLAQTDSHRLIFKSTDGKIVFGIYRNQLKHSYLHTYGYDNGVFDCR